MKKTIDIKDKRNEIKKTPDWIKFFIEAGADINLAVDMAKTQVTRVVETQINIV